MNANNHSPHGCLWFETGLDPVLQQEEHPKQGQELDQQLGEAEQLWQQHLQIHLQQPVQQLVQHYCCSPAGSPC